MEVSIAYLSSLPKVCDRFVQFKHAYGDLVSMLKLLFRNISQKTEKSALKNGGVVTSTMTINSNTYLDVLKQIFGPPPVPGIPVVPAAPFASNVALIGSGPSNAPYEISALLAFITNLCTGPSPDIDFVLSICMQSNIQAQVEKPGMSAAILPQQTGPVPNTSDLSGSSRPQ